MIPNDKLAAVTRALSEAFGVTEFEDIRNMKPEARATLVFRIVVRGTPYLLRVIQRPDPANRHYANMRAAADAGIAPRVWYTNADDKVSITDFIEPAPFSVADALVRIPCALRTLHALAPFEGVPNRINTSCMYLLNQGPELEGFLKMVHSQHLVPPEEREEVFALYQEVFAIYPRNPSDWVSSHNDLKPENMVFDGWRLWIVDWEAAFFNDRYVDLAMMANHVVISEEDERVYLQAYLGQPPDDYHLARLYLMRQIHHIFFAVAYLMINAGGKAVDWTERVPDYWGLLRRIWQREVSLEDNPVKTAYGKAHWDEALRNLRSPRFRESLRILTSA